MNNVQYNRLLYLDFFWTPVFLTYSSVVWTFLNTLKLTLLGFEAVVCVCVSSAEKML